MSKKHQSRPDGLAYSTNKAFFEDYQEENYAVTTLPKNQQKLRVSLDTKQRAGKVVTLVSGFVGTEADLEALGKLLKTKCGTGGSVKDGLVMVQGDYKQKIIGCLLEWGYSNTK
jgi:translation initiation factor 1